MNCGTFGYRVLFAATLGTMSVSIWGCAPDENGSGTGGSGGSGGGNGGGTLQLASNGAPCTTNSLCNSGYCVDGVCCDTACDGVCEACAASKKGNGVDGVCEPIAANADPDDECPQGDCDGTAVCTVKSPDGTACTAASQCLSGHCVDGVCCDTACDGACRACNMAATIGICSEITTGQSDPNATPPCNGTCDQWGRCVTTTTQVCASGIECPSLICNDGLCESTKPILGPLQWMTITSASYDIFDIAAFNDSRGLAFTGWRVDTNSLGSVTADGIRSEQPIGSINSEYASASRAWVGRGGITAFTEVTNKWCTMQNSNCTYFCTYTYPVSVAGTIVGLAGRNDAGQFAVIHHPDGCGHILGLLSTATYERFSSNGTSEFSAPMPSNINDPWATFALGPAGEFHWGSGAKITKLDVNMAPSWTKQPVVSGKVESSAWDVDAMGNILIALSFSGSVDYGGGPMIAFGPRDFGLVKLNPAGNVIWQKHFGSSGLTMGEVSLSRTGTGDMAVSGSHVGPVNLGAGTLSGAYFLAKFDPLGNVLWQVDLARAKHLWVRGDVFGDVYVIATLYVNGYYNNADFGWGPLQQTIFAKYR